MQSTKILYLVKNKKEPNMSFINNLKFLRIDRGISQKELAQSCNLSPQCISALETGRNLPTANTLNQIANYFKISVDELLGRDELTPDERAAGATDRITISITPIEEELLYNFRKVGKNKGEAAQRAIVELVEKML